MFILLLLTLITLSAPLHGMKNEIMEYQQQCQIIQRTLNAEKNDFLEMVYNQQLNPAEELLRIERKFAFYKEKIEQEKNASLLQLKDFHNISNDDWQWCMEITKDISDAIKKAINELPDALHENVMSSEKKMILAQYLHMYGLNIKKINIKNNISNYNAPTYSCQVIINDTEESILISTNKPGMTFSKSTTKAQSVTFAWIFAHLTCEHPGLLYSLIQKSDKNYSIETLYQSNEFIHLENIQKKQSDILPSLENYDVCKWITKDRSDCIYSTNTSYEHFQQLYTIKNLWEKRKILKELIQK